MIFQVLFDMNPVFLTLSLAILPLSLSPLLLLAFHPVLIQLSFPTLGPFAWSSVHLKAFPQVFAWLDLSWNKSNSTQGWILSSQNLIPFLISSIRVNFLFPLLDLPQLYQCFWFSFSKKQLLFYYPNKFYFCCCLFLFQFIYTFYFL